MEILLLVGIGVVLFVAAIESTIEPPPAIVEIDNGFEGDYWGDLSEIPDEPPGSGERSNVHHILNSTGAGGPPMAASDLKDLKELSELLTSEKYYKAASRVNLRAKALASFYNLPI